MATPHPLGTGLIATETAISRAGLKSSGPGPHDLPLIRRPLAGPPTVCFPKNKRGLSPILFTLARSRRRNELIKPSFRERPIIEPQVGAKVERLLLFHIDLENPSPSLSFQEREDGTAD